MLAERGIEVGCSASGSHASVNFSPSIYLRGPAHTKHIYIQMMDSGSQIW